MEKNAEVGMRNAERLEVGIRNAERLEVGSWNAECGILEDRCQRT
jgi:hypothetical protein